MSQPPISLEVDLGKFETNANRAKGATFLGNASMIKGYRVRRVDQEAMCGNLTGFQSTEYG